MGDPLLTDRPVIYSNRDSPDLHTGFNTQRSQKLNNERERLQRPESPASENGYDSQLKLQQAMLRRQELLDRIRQEQLNDDKRPRTYTPRKRYTPSPLPPPSRRSLPDINRREYHFHNGAQSSRDMAQVKHVIEHQFRQAPAPQQQQNYTLPPIPQGQLTTVQPVSPPLPVVQPAYAIVNPADNGRGTTRKDTMFNKADFMDMMMLQNAQMHHMVMQQMMLHQLPGGARPASIATLPFAEPAAPVALMRPAPSIYHHHINQQPYAMPPMDYYQQGYGW